MRVYKLVRTNKPPLLIVAPDSLTALEILREKVGHQIRRKLEDVTRRACILGELIEREEYK